MASSELIEALQALAHERKIDELFESVSDAELIDIVKDIQKLTDCLDALEEE